MPTPTPTPEPLGTRAAPGGPSTATLSVATVVAIGLVGALFYLARGPLSVALGLPLAEHAPIDAASESPDAPAAAPLAAEPREATVRQVDPRWNLLKVQRALEAGGEAVEALIPQARTELAQLDPLDDADPVRAARAQRRFDAWGRTWINRLRAVARGLPSEEHCAVHVSMAPKCRALRLVLAEAAHAPKEASLGGARDRLDGAAERVERMLQTPPPDPERDEGDGGSSEAPGA